MNSKQALPNQPVPFVVSAIRELPSPRSWHSKSKHCSGASIASSSSSIPEMFFCADPCPSSCSTASVPSPMLFENEDPSPFSGVFEWGPNGASAEEEIEFPIVPARMTRLRSEVVHDDDEYFEMTRRRGQQRQRGLQRMREAGGSVDESNTYSLVIDRSLYVSISLDEQAESSFIPELPVVETSGQFLTITAETLYNFMRTSEAQERLLIVDCRFEYEYQGGHIAGAMNLSDPSQLVETFFRDTQTVEMLMRRRVQIVLHCEFSSKRGPSMLTKLRELDRKYNANEYPRLFFPELYLLEGGYKEFYTKFPQACDPIDYVPMEHPDFKLECEAARSKLPDRLKKGRSLF